MDEIGVQNVDSFPFYMSMLIRSARLLPALGSIGHITIMSYYNNNVPDTVTNYMVSHRE